MATRLPQARVFPEGLLYVDDFLTIDEERGLLEAIEDVDFRAFVMRGRTARRSVRHYGFGYAFDTMELMEVDPLPEPFVFVRERAERLAGVPEGGFEQALITRYPPGATIGWHRDAPPFGPTIVGVSLLAPCRMRFQRRLQGTRYVHDQTLEPRSAYVLSGTARSAWEHSIPPTKELRYSITFRTIRESRRPPRDASRPET